MSSSIPTDDVLLHGEVKASYFWDDGSGINGDTGAPASGEPMQKGLFAAPSWPLGTKGYVVYEGKTAEFFIGDRGPGEPSQGCDVMLDIDGKTFAELTGESWDETTYTVSGGAGHINVEYYITEWGDGPGTSGVPHPFQNPSELCNDAVSPLPESQESTSEETSSEKESQESAEQEQPTAEQDEEDTSAQAATQPSQDDTHSDAQQNETQEPADAATENTQTTMATEEADSAAFDLVSTEVPMTSAGLTAALLIATGAAGASGSPSCSAPPDATTEPLESGWCSPLRHGAAAGIPEQSPAA